MRIVPVGAATSILVYSIYFTIPKITPYRKRGVPNSRYTEAILNSNKKYFNNILLINATNNLGGNSNNTLVIYNPQSSFPSRAFIGTS